MRHFSLPKAFWHAAGLLNIGIVASKFWSLQFIQRNGDSNFKLSTFKKFCKKKKKLHWISVCQLLSKETVEKKGEPQVKKWHISGSSATCCVADSGNFWNYCVSNFKVIESRSFFVWNNFRVRHAMKFIHYAL